MNLEQDAMLTAIGEMTMDEAREKWASRWSEFCQSLSRWRSIHTLLRMARMNRMQQIIAQSVTDERARIRTINYLIERNYEIQEGIKSEAYNISYFIEQKEELDWYRTHLGERDPFAWDEMFEDHYGYLLDDVKAPRNRKGKKGYRDYIAKLIKAPARYAIAAANLEKEYIEAGGDQALYDLEKESDAYEKEQRSNYAARESALDEIRDLYRQRRRIQDEYDITKPYAMGLLVADIFNSLAQAIQGDIYL